VSYLDYEAVDREAIRKTLGVIKPVEVGDDASMNHDFPQH